MATRRSTGTVRIGLAGRDIPTAMQTLDRAVKTAKKREVSL
jgi:hypothetical protein